MERSKNRTPSPPKVELRGVSLRYFTPESETEALREVSLAVAAGEFLAIVGQSGCGKSTLLSLISGIMKPTSGEILVGGKPVTGPSHVCGYMPQHDHLFEWCTVLDNVLIGARILKLDLREARERGAGLLRSYGLGDFLHHYPQQLSGGMRQRAALARTLCIEPEILLLDEPFSALDFQTRLALSEEVWRILRRESKTVILVTHDISEAVSMADRVVVMSQRPGAIKSDHAIEFSTRNGERPTPFAARREPEFSGYFDKIWGELDIHVGG